VQQVGAGAIGADVAKALALGADAVSIGVGALIALGCNKPTYRHGEADLDARPEYAALGTAPGHCHHCHTGCARWG
jgi:glutamate synthase domain-containing protein 2